MANLHGARRAGRFGAIPLSSGISVVQGSGSALIQRPADLDANAMFFARVEAGSARFRPQSTLGATGALVANSTNLVFSLEPGVFDGDGPFRISAVPAGWTGITLTTDLFFINAPTAAQYWLTPSREEALAGDLSSVPQTTAPVAGFNVAVLALWAGANPATASRSQYSSAPILAGQRVSMPSVRTLAVDLFSSAVVSFWWA